jgi:hypothetical protein
MNKDDRTDFVYFARLGENGPIKIGHAKNLKNRLESIQCHNPHLVTIVCVTDGGLKKEKELHGFFKNYKIHGEWFYPHNDILNYMKSLTYTGVTLKDLNLPPASGSRSAMWKGEKASKRAKVIRIEKKKKKCICERCHSKNAVDFVNTNGDYNDNNLDNWKPLCRRCRMELDGTLDNFISNCSRRIRKIKTAEKCRICNDFYKPLRVGRCHKCNEFFRRNGIERTEMKLKQRKNSPCINCKRENVVIVNDRCHTCYEYKRRNSKDRDVFLWL